MTVLNLIKRAMRTLGILQTQEEPDAAEAQDVLSILNSMLKAWELEGIKLAHVDMVLTDTLPYPDNHIDPIVYNLAVMIAPEFEVDTRADVIYMAKNSYRNLQNYYHDATELSVDTALHPLFSPNSPHYH
jgi:hypothetical protein